MSFIKWLRRGRVHRIMALYTRAEVAAHNKLDDCWVVIDSTVYDVSGFLAVHPGGPAIVAKYAGQDCTEAFNREHSYVKHGDVLFNEAVGTVID
jgi:cytochrome b involved in lipid metabolism